MYRSLWIAALVSNVGTFMHIVAAGWAMTSLTDSPTLVGLVQTSWAVPGFVLALHAGAFADMVERRRLIALTQVLALVIAAALGVLEMTGNLGVTTLLVGTFLESVALTIAAPAFMALTPQLVGTQSLSQAFGLDSVSRNIAQSVGPALAGAVIAFTNPGAVFILNAVSFVGILIVVRKFPKFTIQVESASKINHVIKDGIKHVVRTAQLRNIALRLALVLGATASLNSVMPVADGADECVVLHFHCPSARSLTRARFFHRHAYGLVRYICRRIRMGIHRIVNFGSCCADRFRCSNRRNRCTESCCVAAGC